MPYKDPEKQKEAQKKSYFKNIDKNRIKNKTYREKVREYVRVQKESNPCVDCGVAYPYYVMEYDHIEDNKIRTVAKITSSGSMDQVIKEIAKCELICSNCHKIRTWERIQEKLNR
jgi:ATP-dependent Lon protease